MLRAVKVAFMLLLAWTGSAPAAETYAIDPRHTYPAFEVSHYGFSMQRGRFERSSGSIVLDRAARSGSVDLVIDAASISMGLEAWNEKMRSADFFDAARFPVIRFRSRRLLFEGDRPVAAEGELTMLGVSRALTLSVTNFFCGESPMTRRPTCGADVTASLRRSDFGMTRSLPGVADEVRLVANVEAQRLPVFAYVPNEKSGTVSVIDTATDTVVGEIRIGGKPRGLAAGRELYVSDQTGNRLALVDLGRREIRGSVALGDSPEGVGLSPDGRWVAVANETTNSVSVIDAAADREAFRVPVRGHNPEHPVFSPDGRWIYVSAEEGGALDIIDFAARTVAAQIPLGERPRGIGFLPDGSRAYVAAENADTVFVIDTAAQRVIAHIAAGRRCNGVAVHPDGRRVYISNGGAASVSVIDAADHRVVATIPVGQRPWNMALTPDGAKLYVANGRSNSVTVIDTATQAAIKEVAVGELPWGVVVR